MGLRRCVEVEPGGAALGAGDARTSVDLDLPHPRDVDHQSSIDCAVPGWVVSAAADGYLQLTRLREPKSGCDVLGVEAACDDGRPAIDQQVEAKARRLEFGVRGEQDVPA